MKKTFYVLPLMCLLLLGPYLMKAQDKYANNVIHADLGYQSFFPTPYAILSASANYERRIVSLGREWMHLYGRIGIGYANNIREEAGPGLNGGLTLLFGRTHHHLEVAGGIFLGEDFASNAGIWRLPQALVGYRFQQVGEVGLVSRVFVGYQGAGFGMGVAF